MKKLMIFLILASGFIITGCNKDGQSNEFNPMSLLFNYGTASLTVNATYTGPMDGDGSGKIFVYLYSSLGTSTRDPEPIYRGSTDAAVTSGSEATIRIDNIKDGSYNMLLFYDYDFGNNHDDNYGDFYTLYNGTAYTTGTAKITVAGNTVLDDISFTNANVLGDGSVYATTATYNVSIDATYISAVSGDAGATKKLYLYLYNTLGTSTANPALPVKMGESAGIAVQNIAQTITASDIAPGNYYALVFYDARKGDETTVDGQDDPYLFFSNTPYKSNAQQFVVSITNGNVTLPAVSFGDANVLQANGVYKTPAALSTLTVTAQYANAVSADLAATRKIWVYMYSVLGNGTRDKYLPIYTGATSDVVVEDTDADIVIDNIVPGTYYLVFIYDSKKQNDNIDGKTDKYELYDNFSLVGDADAFLIDDATETIAGVVITSSWQLGSDSLLPGNYFIQP